MPPTDRDLTLSSDLLDLCRLEEDPELSEFMADMAIALEERADAEGRAA